MAKHKHIAPASNSRRKVWTVALVAVTAGMTTGVSWNHVNEQRETALLQAMHQRVDAETAARLADEEFFAQNRQDVKEAAARQLRVESQQNLDGAVAVAQQVILETGDQVLDAAVLSNLNATLSSLATAPPTSPASMSSATDTVLEQTEQVRVQHAAWAQEQARIAAEAEAARVAAEEKAAQERAAQEKAAQEAAAKKDAPRKKAAEPSTAPAPADENPAPAPAPAPAPQGRSYTKSVWAYGHQGEIDACKGAVLSDYGSDGISIGEHNHCGGKYVLSLKVGDTVTLTGVINGTYQVVGSQDVSKNSSSSVLGGNMWLQTCYFNSSTMRLVQIVPM